MTGEKNRGVSLEKLWNLDDKQLTTPKHDELVLAVTSKWLVGVMPGLIELFSNPNDWVWGFDKTIVSDDNARTRALAKPRNEEKGVRDPEFGYRYQDPYIRETQTEPMYHIREVGYSGEVSQYRSGPYEKSQLFSRLESGKFIQTEEDKQYDEKQFIDVCKRRDRDIKLVELNKERNLQLKMRDESLLEEETKNQRLRSEMHIKYYEEFCRIIKTFDISTLFKIRYEVPIVQPYNNFIIGYWDIVSNIPDRSASISFSDGHTYTTRYTGELPAFYIEVKPFVDSFGAVIRQINTYKNYMKFHGEEKSYPVVCILTPDATFDRAFESQDIVVIHP